MRVIDRDLIRGGHYGQRSCEPHLKAEHMAAPTNAAKREESSCQSGAVHTWHRTDLQRCLQFGRYRGKNGHPVCAGRGLKLTRAGSGLGLRWKTARVFGLSSGRVETLDKKPSAG